MDRYRITKFASRPDLKWSGRLTAALLLAAGIHPLTAQSLQSGKRPAANEKQLQEPVFKVVSPLGESTAKMITMVPRLSSLAGKTVCMTWNRAFKADITLPAIGEALKQKYPDLRVVPFQALPDAHLAEPPGTSEPESAVERASFRANGCDAVISGNGG
jgi:hypothetical protein